VSDTAAAQGGQPVVPGPPAPKVRFALVGLGKLMAEEIFPALRQSHHCEVTALITGNADKGRAFASQLGIPESRVMGYDAIPRLASDGDIDAVYIATPDALHARDAVAALKAGKHVLCEKPLVTTVADGEAMIQAARESGKKLMTAYRVHHEPINRQMKTWIKERKYGRPHFVVFDTVQDVGQRGQYRLQRELAGGGSLFDIGIYALNTTCWLLDEVPVEVAAMRWDDPDDPRFDEVEGNIAFQLRFPSGCVANCTSSYGTVRVNRYRVICDRGWLGMEPATVYRGLKGMHGTDDEVIEMHKPDTVNQFAAEFDHFAQAVRDGTEVDSSGEEGLRDVKLMEAIYEAARTGQRVKISG